MPSLNTTLTAITNIAQKIVTKLSFINSKVKNTNVPSGLVELDSTGKIPSGLYEISSDKYLSVYGGVVSGSLSITDNLTFLGGYTIKTAGQNCISFMNDDAGRYLQFSKTTGMTGKVRLDLGGNNNISYISNIADGINLTATSGRVILKSKGATNFETADLRLNNNQLNTANGLVQLDSTGKISTTLYNDGSKLYLPLSGGNISGNLTILSGTITVNDDIITNGKINAISGIAGNLIVEKNIILLSGTTIKTTGSNGLDLSNDLVGTYIHFDKPSDQNRMRVAFGGNDTVSYIATTAGSMLLTATSGRITLKSKGATNFETADLRLNNNKINTVNGICTNNANGILAVPSGVTVGSQYLNARVYNGAVTSNIYNANYTNGDFHNITISTATTLTVTNIPLGCALILRANITAGSLTFGGTTLIQSGSTGTYYMTFNNPNGTIELIGKAIKLS